MSNTAFPVGPEGPGGREESPAEHAARLREEHTAEIRAAEVELPAEEPTPAEDTALITALRVLVASEVEAAVRPDLSDLRDRIESIESDLSIAAGPHADVDDRISEVETNVSDVETAINDFRV